MRRPLTAFLFALALAGPALCGPTLDELEQDPAKKKELDKGKKALDEYFKAEAEERKGKGSFKAVMDGAQDKFLKWLGSTPGTALAIDLRAQPDVVIQMIDRARVKYLEKGYKKGSIEYVKIENAKGMKRHEYAILVPTTYEPEKRKIPVVVTLHGRVINPRHPAFRNAAFVERGRESIWSNWFKTPAAESAIVIAPTTNPDGFQFTDNHQEDLQALYRTLGEALTEYRGDWDRVFLEVHGRAIRVACEQALVFAGIIVRDRIDDRKTPFLPPDEFFLLENLNGVPLVYVADAANWKDVGQPMSDALTAAYAKAGVPQNLIVIQAQRDVDGALRGGEEKIKDFIQKTERPRARDKFTWRFCTETQKDPVPLAVTAPNFSYDVSEAAKKAPMSAKCGRISFECKRDVADGKQVNRIDIQITEAEGLKLSLYEPLLNLDLPVTITVNGVPTVPPVQAQMFDRDWDLFFDKILPLRFFMLPFLNEVDVTFPSKPEFVAPAAPPAQPPAQGQAGDGGKPAEGTPAGGSAPAAGSPGGSAAENGPKDKPR